MLRLQKIPQFFSPTVFAAVTESHQKKNPTKTETKTETETETETELMKTLVRIFCIRFELQTGLYFAHT